MTQDTQLLALLGGIIVPLLVGIVAKMHAPAGLKGILNAALSAAAAAIANVVPASFNWKPFLITWATTWVVSVATYYGLWKPTGVAGAVQSSTAGVGIGPSGTQ